MNMKSNFVSFLLNKYPNFNQDQLTELISENLLSPFQITLSADIVTQIQTEIKNYWRLRKWGTENLKDRYEKLGLRTPPNYGVSMSYDFHIHQNENQLPSIELIEINTNASFLALGLEMYEFLKLDTHLNHQISEFSQNELVQMFINENKLSNNSTLNLSILDENPIQQKLYLEFLIYQNILRNNNIECMISDISQSQDWENSSLIYNRYTDFYLQEEKSKKLKDLFNSGSINLTPHPYEYFLLADKERFIDWSLQSEITPPKSLLATYDLGKTDKEKTWSERKNLFFKPKNAFGSKQVYKGASMSRKVFDEVSNSNFIAQKISPAPEVEFDFDNTLQKYKYDLRCYAYQDQLQLIVARIYQGQTTNLRSAGGGFACVKVV